MTKQEAKGWVIDAHIHLHDYAPGQVKAWADRKQLAGYLLAGLACYREGNNEMCLQAKLEDPDRAWFFAGLAHPCADYAAQLQSWLQKGADGLKLLETKPARNTTLVDLSGEEFDGMFALCEEQQIPILWHVGDPATFWDPEKAPDWAKANGWYYGEGDYPTLQQLYAQAEKVLARHPRLKVCFAHLYFCSDDMPHAQRLLDAYPNLRLDITPGTEMYTAFFADREAWRAFFLRNAGRIQMGSDTDWYGVGDDPNATVADDLAVSALLSDTVTANGYNEPGLDLPDETVRAICRENFLKFVKRG